MEIIKEELRATGKTTRLVDEYIQKLYSCLNDYIEIKDHFNSFHSNKYLQDLIIKRLISEHPRDKYELRGNNIRIIKNNK